MTVVTLTMALTTNQNYLNIIKNWHSGSLEYHNTIYNINSMVVAYLINSKSNLPFLIFIKQNIHANRTKYFQHDSLSIDSFLVLLSNCLVFWINSLWFTYIFHFEMILCSNYSFHFSMILGVSALIASHCSFDGAGHVISYHFISTSGL